MVTKEFRKFLTDHGIRCTYNDDGTEIDDGHIMYLYGLLRKTWELATEKKQQLQAADNAIERDRAQVALMGGDYRDVDGRIIILPKK